MRKPSLFDITVAVVIALGLAAATAAILERTTWAIAFGGLAMSGLALLILFLDRRRQADGQQTRRATGQVRQATGRILADVRRLEVLVDAMQRRLVSSMDSARVEAAERHRSSTETK